jgi:hypothetical protein
MARFIVTFRDGSPARELSVGAFAQIAAKRRYGVAAITGNEVTGEPPDPEAGVFACFVELVGPQEATRIEAFDEWLQTVEDFAPAKNGDGAEDPPPAEGSNVSSPASPPTSD